MNPSSPVPLLQVDAALLLGVLDSLADGIVVVGAENEVLVMNGEAERILGLTDVPTVGRCIDDLAATWLLRDRGAYAVSKMRHHLQRGSAYRNDTAFAISEDGSTIDVSLVMTPMELSGGGRGALIAIRDVSAIRAAENVLRESDEQSRAAFRMAPTGLVRLDLAGCVAASNEAFCSMLGRDERDLVGTEITALVEPDEVDVAADVLDLVLRGQEPSWQGERRWRGPGGTVWTSTAMALVRGRNRQGDFAICVVEDLTHRRTLEIELRQAQKLESVGRLSAGIAHEINTPIQFVADNLRFLGDAYRATRSVLGAWERAGGTVPDEVRAAVEEHDLRFFEDEVPYAVGQGIEGIDRIATIVRAMKSFGESAGHERALVDLNEAVANTVVIARPETEPVADVTVELGDLPAVSCHRGDINQTVLSLLVNAAQAIAEGGAGGTERGAIAVRTWTEPDHVVVAVRDSGPGIPADIGDRIFDPFFTTKPVGTGTGLGLALARSVIVDRHGGSITYESQTGTGTTFLVRLPVAGPSMDSAADHSEWSSGSR
jgi:PAS domain S-box-containing protein